MVDLAEARLGGRQKQVEFLVGDFRRLRLCSMAGRGMSYSRRSLSII